MTLTQCPYITALDAEDLEACTAADCLQQCSPLLSIQLQATRVQLLQVRKGQYGRHCIQLLAVLDTGHLGDWALLAPGSSTCTIPCAVRQDRVMITQSRNAAEHLLQTIGEASLTGTAARAPKADMPAPGISPGRTERWRCLPLIAVPLLCCSPAYRLQSYHIKLIVMYSHVYGNFGLSQMLSSVMTVLLSLSTAAEQHEHSAGKYRQSAKL